MVLNLHCEQSRSDGVDVRDRESVAAKQRIDRERLCIKCDPAQRPIGAAKPAAAKYGHSCPGCKQAAHWSNKDTVAERSPSAARASREGRWNRG
jgi:hypothetical protein